jgi:hypothetical protein
MGISASQARFLGLTGRKNDVEFQGQQINQSRMMLANTSSAVTTAANAMPVPIIANYPTTDAYMAAVAQYNQDYESRMTTELAPLQLQDKKLELQLKALDTEQQAIQTELEAVAKVIDKNIESSFKTFG